MKKKNESKYEHFKSNENPSYLIIHIQNRETVVKITLNDFEGLRFSIEFAFENKQFKKEFEIISTKEKIYDSDDIEFDRIEIHPIDKVKIAHRLNEILDFHFS